MTAPYSDQFRLSITEALSTQLFAALEKLEPAPLTMENLDALVPLAEKLGLPSKSGVYQLFRQIPGKGRELAYVGKADQPLNKRLEDHFKKLSGREGISIEEISFKCLFVEEDLSSVSPEKMLIKRHLETGKIVWNNRGFGINDPGRERDTTRVKSNHFDLEFPIDLAREVKGVVPGENRPLSEVLKEIKQGLPFNFRFGRSATFKNHSISIPDGGLTADEAFRLVAENLYDKWQICALVGWVVMYNDRPRTYPSAFRCYSPEGVRQLKPVTRKPGKGESEEDVEGEEELDT